MKASFCFAVALAVLCTSALDVTPVQKVTALLQGLLATAQKEKKAEQVAHAEVKNLCREQEISKKLVIDDGQSKIQVLTSEIEKSVSTIARLSKEITEIDKDVGTWTGDRNAAMQVRALEKATFEKTRKDQSESILAMKKAISLLTAQLLQVASPKVASSLQLTPDSLLQVRALRSHALVPDDVKASLASFVQEENDALDEDSEALDARESQVGQANAIVEMIKSMRKKFIASQTVNAKKEAKAKQEFMMLLQGLNDQLSNGKSRKTSKLAKKNKLKGEMASQNGELKDTKKTLAEDQKFLSESQATCKQKANAFKSSQKERKEELIALEKALEIITKQLKFFETKHQPHMLRYAEAASAFSQLRVGVKSKAQQQAASYLSKRAKELDSPVLLELTASVNADPMKKVSKMIKQLIVKLVDKAKEEATQKAYCDESLRTNKKTRLAKTDEITLMQAAADLLKAGIAKNADEISALTDAVAALDKMVAAQTALRTKEKAKNKIIIKDAKAAQKAVGVALTVLKDFYGSSGESFLQEDASTDKQSGAGVIAMLEVIESDFARLDTATTQAEDTSAEQYKKTIQDSKMDKVSKTAEIDHKTSKKTMDEQELIVSNNDITSTQGQLAAAEKVLKKLLPTCRPPTESYADKVAKRKAEIESLKQTLVIFD